jgi:hypothetical protein
MKIFDIRARVFRYILQQKNKKYNHWHNCLRYWHNRKQFIKEIPHQKLNNYVKKVIVNWREFWGCKKQTKYWNQPQRLGKYPKYELIASHCFRRSFATNYYKKDTYRINGITGHSKSLFLTYITNAKTKTRTPIYLWSLWRPQQDKEPQLRIVSNRINNYISKGLKVQINQFTVS